MFRHPKPSTITMPDAELKVIIDGAANEIIAVLTKEKEDSFFKNKEKLERLAVSITDEMTKFNLSIDNLMTKMEEADFDDPQQVFPITLELQKVEGIRDRFKNKIFPALRQREKEFSETSQKEYLSKAVCDGLLAAFDEARSTYDELKPKNIQQVSPPSSRSTSPETSPERRSSFGLSGSN